MGNLARSAVLGLDAFEEAPLELRPFATESELQIIIQAVYRQVLGNQHIMDSERLSSGEAQLRNRDITVRDFVRIVANSNLYQSLFFEGSSQYRFIEMNFKHLLGRSPEDQSEIVEHVAIYNAEGYAAEIDSYIDSDEYVQNFGEDIVPYPRSIRSQDGIKTEGFNRMFTLLGGYATNDSDKRAKLITSIAANSATKINSPAKGNGSAYDNTGKRFKITYAANKGAARLQKYSKQECVVTFSQMSPTVQNIHKSGSTIQSIVELV
ncbi:phycobilisome rod-core linker polypeptide [Calothrix rhizosoleniae]|uniref:phycobilisome rod-core linker polypeptide n=1 Tax=Calothrix rhizosoleniae TaxID=888997 RepID=UPI000B49F7F3|nr:phycobilisome rod-core linker polypeptide [Calothrix rhizosoleniae]